MGRSRKYDNDPIQTDFPQPGEPVVYVYLGSANALYIGSSKNFPRRQKDHRQQDWWPLARRLHVFRYQTLDAALVAEIEFIHEHQPRFNKTHVRYICREACEWPPESDDGYFQSFFTKMYPPDAEALYEELFAACAV